MGWYRAKLYRAFSRFIHRYGIHKLRTFYIEGDKHELCDWCGLRRVTKIDVRRWSGAWTAGRISDWQSVQRRDTDVAGQGVTR